MAKAKKQGKIDVKKVTRAVTAAVIVICLAGLGATAWFISAALNGVASTQNGGVADDVKIEGINDPLLDEIEAALAAKTSPDAALKADLPNPFKKVPPPPPAEPEPEPEPPPPAPEPAPEPEAEPSPNT
jgi:hypothetical protein